MIRRVQDGIAAIFGGKMLFTPIRIETPVWWTIKTKLILAASFLVIFSLQFSSLFNRTALDKLYLESNLIDLAINGKDILYGYEELAEQDDHHDPARVEAALRAARHELFDRLGMEEPAGAMSGYGGDLKIAMVTPEGRISYSTDRFEKDLPLSLPLLNHFKDVLNVVSAPVAGIQFVDGKALFIGYPITAIGMGSEKNPQGMILVSVDKRMMMQRTASSLQYPKKVMWSISLIVIVILTVTIYLAAPSPDPKNNPVTRRNNTIIILLCCVSQAVCSIIFLVTYERQLIDLKKKNLVEAQDRLVLNLQGFSDLERDELEFALKVKAAQTQKIYPAVGEIEFRMNKGLNQIYGEVDEKTVRPWHVRLMASFFNLEDFEIKTILKDAGNSVGTLKVGLSLDHIISKLRDVLLDSITVFAISILMFIEMLLFTGTLFRTVPVEEKEKNRIRQDGVDYRWMRPAAFLLLFAIDLSMSFIPLHLAKLYQPIMGFSKDLVLGLPITVEFIFVGLSIFFAGFWVDRRGWHEPFVIGLALTSTGILYSWLAPNAIHFIISRAFVGTGYGLSLMASQGFVIKFTDWRNKASGLADLFAGIYAGSICGGATGAMLADRYGYNFVFFIGAVIIFSIIAYCFMFMQKAMTNPKPETSTAITDVKANSTGFWVFLRNRIVISLIFFSSMPASIAVVGFLNYFCPIYLNGLGVSQSAIGRMLMLYGVCLVYIGPVIGRWVDLSFHKKNYVFVGCLLGSFTFLMFVFAEGVFATAVAVFILSLSSSFVLSSQSAYILNLKITKAYGEGKAIGIFRSSSRIGQALGPIVFSNLMLIGDLGKGIKLFGLAYLATAIIFIILTRKDRSHTLQEA